MSGTPIGTCCVCDDDLDLTDAGICKTCKQGFCWSSCGGWDAGHHCCDNCQRDGDDEEQKA